MGRAATLLDQARDQPEDPVRWRTASAAVQQVEDDPAGIAPGASDRFARLKADAASGLRDAEMRRDIAAGAGRCPRQPSRMPARKRPTRRYADAFRAADLDVDALSVTKPPPGSSAGPRR